jgi:hypothetical protein
LFGGVLASGQLVSDTWEWDTGTRTWERRTPVQTPPPRSDAIAVYDAIAGHVMMFGGRGASNAVLDDVWTYGFVSSAEPAEVCTDQSDTDHDGLAGCADPDCWGRCTPTCPPGTTCDPAHAHCGDGTCSVIETHALCPADCP